MIRLKVGVLVNPVAGMGGAVGLKGSDGVEVQNRASALGGVPRGAQRMRQALIAARNALAACEVLTWGGAMGADTLEESGITHRTVGACSRFDAHATQSAVAAFVELGVDFIVFAGGDGTARDLLGCVGSTPVIGIPAGVKMHSGVFLSRPERLGELLERLLDGGLVASTVGEVRDIDESAMRADRPAVRYFGEVKVAEPGGYLQHVKEGGVENERLVIEEIAADVCERMSGIRAHRAFIFGPGSTVAAVERKLGLAPRLLGIDVLEPGGRFSRDLSAAGLLEIVRSGPACVVLSFGSGQGALLGRGNLPLSPEVLEHVAKDDLWVVGSRTKLRSLDGRPLFVDTGDAALDARFAGLIEITTGFEDRLWYRVDGG